MDSSLVGLIGIIVVVIIAEAVGLCLRRPLGLLLKSEKGAERSDFWNAYIRVVLLLVPAFFALVSFPSDSLVNPVQALIGELRWGIAGLLIALVVAAKGLHIPAPSRRTAPYVPPIIPPASSAPAR
jgi:uncharacterized membrane protein